VKIRTNDRVILAVSDLQIPFEHEDAYAFVEYCTRRYKPTDVINVGDEVDQHALSRYAHDPDGMSAGDELAESKKRLAKFFELHPDVKACTSNHTDRIYKKAFEAGIPKAYLRSIKEFLGAPPGWNWADEWWIDGIRFSHGDEVGGQTPHKTLAIAVSASCVIGHHHAYPGVDYVANAQRAIWGLNTGCLIDPTAYAFHYTKKTKHKPILGLGLVDHGIPRFIPLITNSRGRWDLKAQKSVG